MLTPAVLSDALGYEGLAEVDRAFVTVVGLCNRPDQSSLPSLTDFSIMMPGLRRTRSLRTRTDRSAGLIGTYLRLQIAICIISLFVMPQTGFLLHPCRFAPQSRIRKPDVSCSIVHVFILALDRYALHQCWKSMLFTVMFEDKRSLPDSISTQSLATSIARLKTPGRSICTSCTCASSHMFVRAAQCRRSASSTLFRRWKSTQGSVRPDILRCTKCTLFKFGDPTSEPSKALFRNLTWRLRDEISPLQSQASKNQEIDKPEAWALIGPRANVLVDSALLGRARADPPESRKWPLFGTSRPIDEVIKKVSFNTRLESNSYLSQGGEFTDYTARYYGIRKDDEDAITLREHLRKYAKNEGLSEGNENETIREVAVMLKLDHLLEIPLIALSNGQTRRARIARALLTRPEVLVLEEPFSRCW